MGEQDMPGIKEKVAAGFLLLVGGAGETRLRKGLGMFVKVDRSKISND